MKHTIIFLLAILSTRATAQVAIAGASTFSVEYAEAQTQPYECPDYNIDTFGWSMCGSGPFVWWRVECWEYAQPVARWTGACWVKDPPCCMKYGGRRFVVIDKIAVRPLGVLVETIRA